MRHALGRPGKSVPTELTGNYMSFHPTEDRGDSTRSVSNTSRGELTSERLPLLSPHTPLPGGREGRQTLPKALPRKFAPTHPPKRSSFTVTAAPTSNELCLQMSPDPGSPCPQSLGRTRLAHRNSREWPILPHKMHAALKTREAGLHRGPLNLTGGRGDSEKGSGHLGTKPPRSSFL